MRIFNNNFSSEVNNQQHIENVSLVNRAGKLSTINGMQNCVSHRAPLIPLSTFSVCSKIFRALQKIDSA